MPLSAAFPTLQSDIEAAFKKMRDAAQADGDTSDKVIAQLSRDLALAIHSYTLQAVVVANGGGPATGVAAPLAPTGAAPVVSAAVVTVSGNLL